MELHILLNFKTEIGGCFQAATDRKMFASCTPTDLWGMDEVLSQMTIGIV